MAAVTSLAPDRPRRPPPERRIAGTASHRGADRCVQHCLRNGGRHRQTTSPIPGRSWHSRRPLRCAQAGRTAIGTSRARCSAPLRWDKTARHWRHQNSSERSPQCPARLRKPAGRPQNAPSHCIGKISDSRRIDGASPARRSVILGKRTHVAKMQQSTTCPCPLQQGSQQKSGATKNPARCPARACRIVLECALTIRDSGNASQDKTRHGILDGGSPGTIW